MHHRPILITGSHRSGSTWVGRTLSLSEHLGYIDEPFNPDRRSGACAVRPMTWFEYVTADDERGWGPALERTLAFGYSWAPGLRAMRSLRDGARTVRDGWRFARSRRHRARALLKDPLAFFAAPWIADRFDAQVILLVRHPAAFASSLKRLNLTFRFSNWTIQPKLMTEVLGPWADEIWIASKTPPDVIDQAALMWKVIYGVARECQQNFPDWIVRRHEDLSREPLPGFRALFGELGIPLTPKIEDSILASSSPTNPAEAPEGEFLALNRDSRANIWTWKSKLDSREIERLRSVVEESSRHFYSDADW
jgi:hypothetical protein